MYKVSFRPLANSDLVEIIEFYDTLSNNLSENFIAELDICVQVLSKNPQAFQKRIEDARIVYLKSFSYGVFYKIYNKEVRIIAILHTSRDPKIWKKR